MNSFKVYEKTEMSVGIMLSLACLLNRTWIISLQFSFGADFGRFKPEMMGLSFLPYCSFKYIFDLRAATSLQWLL